MRQVLGPGALGRRRGIGWSARWEGGSGWGIHVYPWLIHVNVWQKPLQYCKVISLQLIKKIYWINWSGLGVSSVCLMRTLQGPMSEKMQNGQQETFENHRCTEVRERWGPWGKKKGGLRSTESGLKPKHRQSEAFPWVSRDSSLLAFGYREIPWDPCDKFLFGLHPAQGSSSEFSIRKVSCNPPSLLFIQSPKMVTWLSIHSSNTKLVTK